MLTEEEQEFIQDHLTSDVNQLLLNPPNPFKDNIKVLCEQILSRQKAKNKLPKWYANPQIVFPAPISVEQASSEITANYKRELISGKQLVDLTGGMGVDCLALSESFEQTIYVEQNKELCDRFRHNSKLFNKHIEIINGTDENLLSGLDENSSRTFFVDPARRDSHKKKVFRFSDCQPNLVSLLDTLSTKGGKALIKASPLIEPKLGYEELKYVEEIHVVSVSNECKEVLFLLDFSVPNKDNPTIKTVNFTLEGRETFDFSWFEEETVNLQFHPLENYLLIPNSSISKAGAFKSMAASFPINKIASNTHLYTSESPILDFPGRQFKVISNKLTKELIQKMLPSGRVNIITKNYPSTPQQVLKKWKLKEGGESYLIGFKNSDNKPQLILAEKI